jgi:GR25 family glycosyltransferase involved in LPS biosynthesis
MNIIVISLERAKERRERIKTQLAALNLDAVIMDAVDGQSLSNSEKNKTIKNPTTGFRDGETFKPGEVGCLMSHIKAIKLAKENKWDDVLILEDDVILSEDFNKGIKFLFRIVPSDWEHIYLGGHIYFMAAPVFQPSVLPSMFKISGAYCYFLKKTVYDKVISEMSEMELPADDVFEKLILREQQIKSYIFFPFLAYPDIQNSYIWNINGNEKKHESYKHFKNTW